MPNPIRMLTRADWKRIVEAVGAGCAVELYGNGGAQDEAATTRYAPWTSTYRKVSKIAEEMKKYRLTTVLVEPINCPHGIHSPYECSTCMGVEKEEICARQTISG